MGHSKPDRRGATLLRLRPAHHSPICGRESVPGGRRREAMNRWRHEPLLKPEHPEVATPKRPRLLFRTRAPIPNGRRLRSTRASLGTWIQKAELGPLTCPHGFHRESRMTMGGLLGLPTPREPRSDHGTRKLCWSADNAQADTRSGALQNADGGLVGRRHAPIVATPSRVTSSIRVIGRR
jgi:hypothetical protein